MAGNITLQLGVTSGAAPSIQLGGQGGLRTLLATVSSGAAPSIQLPVPLTLDVTLFNTGDYRDELVAETTEEISAITARFTCFGISGSIGRVKKTVTKTDSYTLTEWDEAVICNKATAMTITLLAATGSGRVYHIKSIGVGTVTIDGSGTDTIDGELTQTLFQYDGIIIHDTSLGVWTVI